MCCREGAISALSPWPQSYFEGGLLFKPCCSLIFTGTGEAGGCVCKGKAFLPLCKCWERRHGRHAGSSPAPTQGWHPALAPGADQTPFLQPIHQKDNKWRVKQLAKSELNPQHLQIFSPKSPQPRGSPRLVGDAPQLSWWLCQSKQGRGSLQSPPHEPCGRQTETGLSTHLKILLFRVSAILSCPWFISRSKRCWQAEMLV